jgi:hypothetical protein
MADVEEHLDTIIIEAPAPRAAVEKVHSRRRSSQNNTGVFSTPRYNEEQYQSGSNNGHAAVAKAISIEDAKST